MVEAALLPLLPLALLPLAASVVGLVKDTAVLAAAPPPAVTAAALKMRGGCETDTESRCVAFFAAVPSSSPETSPIIPPSRVRKMEPLLLLLLLLAAACLALALVGAGEEGAPEGGPT